MVRIISTRFRSRLSRVYDGELQILYFACRYLMLFALVGVLVALNVTSQINCQVRGSLPSTSGYMRVYSSIFRPSTRSIRFESLNVPAFPLSNWNLIIRVVFRQFGYWSCINPLHAQNHRRLESFPLCYHPSGHYLPWAVGHFAPWNDDCKQLCALVLSRFLRYFPGTGCFDMELRAKRMRRYRVRNHISRPDIFLYNV
jgi:hypothetical protein